MTDDQLDEWLAVKVMGWTLDLIENEWGLRYYRDADGKSVMDARLWQPTRDLNQAVECVEKLRDERGYLMRIYYQTETKYLVWFVLYSDKNGRILKEIWGKPNAILSRALCEAVAMAVEGEKE